MPTEHHFFNRELSWLEFNERVLKQALDKSLPLLDRLKFLAITSSNLDEFFMVRVGGLQLMTRRGNNRPDPSGMTPNEQLQAIRTRTDAMYEQMYHCYRNELEPQLAAAGIRRIPTDQISARQFKELEKYVDQVMLSVMTPIAVTGADDFPLMLSGSIAVAVRLMPSARIGGDRNFAIIPLGQTLARFYKLQSQQSYDFLFLEDIVGMMINRFFPQESILECAPFRITRNADWNIDEDDVTDFMAEMQEVVMARRQSHCVRLEIQSPVTSVMKSFLEETLQVDEAFVQLVNGPLALSSMMSMTSMREYDSLRSPSWEPREIPDIDDQKTMFENMRQCDVAILQPYEAFDPVIRLIEEAAVDANVLSIKQTLYRTSKNSPIVNALCRAAQSGKYVTAVIELKARFDEQRNIDWAEKLEQAGVQVIYGVKELKTHAKVCVITRKDEDGAIGRYMHFSTGNYNEITARFYTDVSYLTCNDDLATDAVNFFNAITGASLPGRFHSLEAAPFGMRDRIQEMIDAEIENCAKGIQAVIKLKVNSLVDSQLIQSLYKASQAGVKIEINCRGICCLKPDVAGLSDNIRVVSIVDQFLEHARVLYFYHGGDERVFISSADWMPRNLDRRVELLVPIEDANCARKVLDMLNSSLSDNTHAWELQSNGSYKRLHPKNKSEAYRSQAVMSQLTDSRLKEHQRKKMKVLEPHLPPEKQ